MIDTTSVSISQKIENMEQQYLKDAVFGLLSALTTVALITICVWNIRIHADAFSVINTGLVSITLFMVASCKLSCAALTKVKLAAYYVKELS